jgi:hypothetical protein
MQLGRLIRQERPLVMKERPRLVKIALNSEEEEIRLDGAFSPAFCRVANVTNFTIQGGKNRFLIWMTLRNGTTSKA